MNIQELTKLISKVTSAKIDIKIKDLKKPESNAMLIAQNIAKQIAARIPFRRAMKKAISDAKKGGVSGIKIQCAGRLGGADMARTEWYREGRIPLQTLRADIDYAYTVANTTYGIIGIKVWVFTKEILKKDVKEDAGQLVKKQKKFAGKKGEE
jgi:small subunit ribosomal protein S3